MNTFLPHMSYVESAKALDGKRLNKQLTECWQLILCYVKVHDLDNEQVHKHFGHYALLKKIPAMRHHPAYRMWDDNFTPLICYTQAIGIECVERGYKAGVIDSLDLLLNCIPLPLGDYYPKWWCTAAGDAFREDCRANLKRKDPTHYKYDTMPKEGYRWP